jgi:hypothetical protein
LEGKFSIPGVKPGKYIFRVTSVGFKPYYKDVVLVASKPSMAIGTIKLQTNAAIHSNLRVVNLYFAPSHPEFFREVK